MTDERPHDDDAQERPVSGTSGERARAGAPPPRRGADDDFVWEETPVLRRRSAGAAASGEGRDEGTQVAPGRGDVWLADGDDLWAEGRAPGRGAAPLAPPAQERDARRDQRGPDGRGGAAAPSRQEAAPSRPDAAPSRPDAAPSRREPGVYDVEEEWEEWLEPGGPHGAETAGRESGRPAERRRRRAGAGAVLAAMLLGFFIAGLLDAKAIEADTKAQPYGAWRSVRLALLKPMTGLSGLLHADRVAVSINDALGRGEERHHTLAEVKPPPKPLWPREITAGKPLRLYVAGDSMGQVFGSSLVNLAEETGLIRGKNDYHVSSGLTRPDYYDWPQHLIDQIVERRPDAVVVLFGANDGQNVLHDGTVLKVGTKGWQQVYARRVGEAMDILTTQGRRVYWVGNPIMKDYGYRKRIAMMNHIYEAEAKKHPGVTFVSTWAAMANGKGSYADYLKDNDGDRILMRAPDGIHLTREGGDRMAKVVLDVIERDWGMTASPAPRPSPAEAGQ